MVKITNKIVNKIVRINLSAYQNRVLFAMFKVNDYYKQKNSTFDLSLTRYSMNFEIIQITGLKKNYVSRSIKELKERRIIIKTGNRLAINKEISQWH